MCVRIRLAICHVLGAMQLLCAQPVTDKEAPDYKEIIKAAMCIPASNPNTSHLTARHPRSSEVIPQHPIPAAPLTTPPYRTPILPYPHTTPHHHHTTPHHTTTPPPHHTTTTAQARRHSGLT